MTNTQMQKISTDIQADQPLSDFAKFNIKQTAATMNVEDMSISQQCIRNMMEYSSGQKSSEQLVSEIYERYRAI